MPSERIVEILEKTLAEVLEEAAFSFSEPLEPSADWEGPLIVAEIDYVGPESGRLTLAIPEACARELAANLLGLEPGGSEDLASARDSVAELLNIVVGAMMPELFDAQARVQLGIPQVFDEAPEACGARMKACEARAALRVDEEHRVELGATSVGETA